MQGPYRADSGDPAFKGKITYRYCRKPVFPPSNWDGSLLYESAKLPKVGNKSDLAPHEAFHMQSVLASLDEHALKVGQLVTPSAIANGSHYGYWPGISLRCLNY